MSSLARTGLFVIVAAALVGLAWLSSPEIAPPELYDDVGEEFFPEFTDPDQAAALEVVEFAAETAEMRPFRVQKKDGRWTIPSHHGYPADAKEQMAESAGMLIGLAKAGVRSDSTEDHALYGVLDPKDPAAGLEGRGTLVLFEDRSGNEVASLIIGKEIEGKEDQRYVRIPGKKRTYIANLPTLPSTRFENWIEKDLLDVTSYDLDELIFDNYTIDETNFSRVPGEVVRITKPDFDWTVDGLDPETEETNDESVRAVTTALADLEIVGVRAKPAGLTRNLTSEKNIGLDRQSLMSLESRGFFAARDGNLYSNEGDLIARSKKGVSYTLRFGEVLYGSGEAVTAGSDEPAQGASPEEPGEKAGGAHRYLMVTSSFDEKLLEKPEQEALAGEELAKRKTARQSLEKIVAAIERYRAENETLPESLAALTTPPAAVEGEEPGEPALAELEKDPWDNDFVYQVTTEGEDQVFTVVSHAADGAAGGERENHDISSADLAHEDGLAKLVTDWEAYNKNVEEGKEEAARLSERFAPWYYVISDESFKKLRPPRSDLVKPKEAEEPEEVELPGPIPIDDGN